MIGKGLSSLGLANDSHFSTLFNVENQLTSANRTELSNSAVSRTERHRKLSTISIQLRAFDPACHRRPPGDISRYLYDLNVMWWGCGYSLEARNVTQRGSWWIWWNCVSRCNNCFPHWTSQVLHSSFPSGFQSLSANSIITILTVWPSKFDLKILF